MAEAGGKVLGVDRKQGTIIVVAAGGAFAVVWWLKRRSKGTSSSATSATVITGSTSSSTGINAALLNAILKDWQQSETGEPGASSSVGTIPKEPPPLPGGGRTASTGGHPPKKPPTHWPKPVHGKPVHVPGQWEPDVTYSEYTVRKGDTIAALARRFGITPAQLAHSNVYVKGEVPGDARVGQTLGTGAGLKTGQVLRVPHYSSTGLGG